MPIDSFSFQQVFVLLLLIGVFIAFMTEKLPPDIVALTTSCILLITGILSTDEVLSVLTNPGVVTVGTMFILSAALERTGGIQACSNKVRNLIGRSPFRALLLLSLITISASVFMNNTPVVVILTPIAIQFAHHTRIAPSKLLIPVSYAAIFGGTCTLIGTSTNLLVDGVGQELHQPPFGMFEITEFALIMTFIGLSYMILFGYHLLPNRESIGSPSPDFQTKRRQFLTEMIVPSSSHLIGKTLAQAHLMDLPQGRIIDLIRHGQSYRYQLNTLTLQVNDRLLIKIMADGLMELRQHKGIAFTALDTLQEFSTHRLMIIEGIVGPRSWLLNRRLRDAKIYQNYGVYILAVHRKGENLQKKFNRVCLEVGDTLILEGRADGVQRLIDTDTLINPIKPHYYPLRLASAWFAVSVMILLTLLSSLNIFPIVGLALCGAVAVMIVGCLDHQEAYKAIDWRVIFMILGMLTLGLGLQKTGCVSLIATFFVDMATILGPRIILSLLYLITWLLTELISNNAVGVFMTPIAVAIASSLGIDPRPFLVAVMFSSSTSFTTPVGYQTNTFIYGAGGYQFKDFIRVGLPLNLIFWITSSILIPLFWPLLPYHS